MPQTFLWRQVTLLHSCANSNTVICTFSQCLCSKAANSKTGNRNSNVLHLGFVWACRNKFGQVVEIRGSKFTRPRPLVDIPSPFFDRHTIFTPNWMGFAFRRFRTKLPNIPRDKIGRYDYLRGFDSYTGVFYGGLQEAHKIQATVGRYFTPDDLFWQLLLKSKLLRV